MTAYSMTMSAAIVAFGGAPTDKWAAYNWNAFKWGQGTNTIAKTIRMAVNTTNLSLASTAAINWRFVHLLAGGTLTPADAVNFQYVQGVSESLAMADILEHAYVQDPEGYFRVFPEGVTDITLRTTPTWAAAASAAASWSTATAGTTVWS